LTTPTHSISQFVLLQAILHSYCGHCLFLLLLAFILFRYYIFAFLQFLKGKKGKKVFPYSLPSVGPGADPGVQAVSPQVT